MKKFEMFFPLIAGVGLFLIILGFAINEAITAIIGVFLVTGILLIGMIKGIAFLFRIITDKNNAAN